MPEAAFVARLRETLRRASVELILAIAEVYVENPMETVVREHGVLLPLRERLTKL